MEENTPWQLLLFKKTLKKKLRLQELRKYIGNPPQSEKCLLITCGDNNGAMNYRLRELGGTWSWADLEKKSIAEMSQLLGEEVKFVKFDSLPYPDGALDLTVCIDCHEHLSDPVTFTKELHRITRKDGRVIITVPGGRKHKLANILKNAVGMTKEKYGHVVEGYSIPEMKAIMRQAGIHPVRQSTFSRFFTEFLELLINFAYVQILSKKSEAEVEEGTIAPATEEQVKSVEKTVKLYSLIYPFFWLFSQLDWLVFFTRGYVIVVEGKN